MRARNWRVAAALAVVVVVAAGCGSGSDDASGATTTVKGPGAGKTFQDQTGSDTVVVKAVDNDFQAQFVTVKQGAKVTFENDGRNRHDVVPDDSKAFAEIPTDSFDPGESGTVTFSKPGEYGYYCSLHGTPTQGMYGVIKVEG